MSKRLAGLLGLTAFFLLTGVIYTWPLVSFFTDGLPTTRIAPDGHQIAGLVQGDYLQMYYQLWLMHDAVLSQNAPLFSNIYEFAVTSFPKDLMLYYFPVSAPFLIAGIFCSSIISYNVLILSSFVITGIVSFLLILLYVERWPAALAGSLVYTLAPYRLASLIAGNPNGFTFFLLPLMVLFLERMMRKRNALEALWAGICLLSMGVADPHMIYYVFLFFPVFFIWRRVFDTALSGRGRIKAVFKRGFSDLLLLIPFIVFACITVGYLMYMKSIILDTTTVEGGRTLQEVRLYSPLLADLFRRTNPNSSTIVYPGFAAVLLAVFGIWSAFTRNRKQWAAICFFGVMFIVATWLSFGPNIAFPPLYKICYKLIPHFNYIRQTSKIMLFSVFGLSVLTWLRRFVAYLRKTHEMVRIRACLCFSPGIPPVQTGRYCGSPERKRGL